MKKLLMIAALASLSSPAFASKARLNALGNADHLVDAQTTFDNPSHLTLLPDFITLEGGPSTAASPSITPGTTTWEEVYATNNPGAEGGFVQSSGDAKWAAYLGRKSAFTNTARKAYGFLTQENPIELQYAMKGPMAWGVRLNYSSSNIKTTSQKQTAAGVGFGATTDLWEAYAIVGLTSTADGTAAGNLVTYDKDNDGIVDGAEISALAADTTATYKGTTGLKVGGAYKMDNIRIYGRYGQDGFKYTTGGGVASTAAFDGMEVKASQIDVGVVDATKLDGGQWFYGVGYSMVSQKQSFRNGTEVKTEKSFLPFLAGIEHDAATWLALRASVTQNVLLGSEKVDDGAITTMVDDANTVHNNTKVAAGFGLKFNKWIVDGSWSAATSATGAINANSLLTNVALTYNF